jgi:hypothetical protein
MILSWTRSRHKHNNEDREGLLQTAYSCGHGEAMRQLIKHITDVDTSCYVFCALSLYAPHTAQPEIISLPLQHSTGVNARNDLG